MKVPNCGGVAARRPRRPRCRRLGSERKYVKRIYARDTGKAGRQFAREVDSAAATDLRQGSLRNRDPRERAGALCHVRAAEQRDACVEPHVGEGVLGGQQKRFEAPEVEDHLRLQEGCSSGDLAPQEPQLPVDVLGEGIDDRPDRQRVRGAPCRRARNELCGRCCSMPGKAGQAETVLPSLAARPGISGAIIVLPPEPSGQLVAQPARGFPFVVVDPRTPMPRRDIAAVSRRTSPGSRSIQQPRRRPRAPAYRRIRRAARLARERSPPGRPRLGPCRHRGPARSRPGPRRGTNGPVRLPGRRGAARPAAAAHGADRLQRQGRRRRDHRGGRARPAHPRGPVRRRLRRYRPGRATRRCSPRCASRCRRWAASRSACSSGCSSASAWTPCTSSSLPNWWSGALPARLRRAPGASWARAGHPAPGHRPPCPEASPGPGPRSMPTR